MARVLLIEDDAELAALLVRYFGAQGHVVVVAPTGEAALEEFLDGTFDVVICDHRLPGKKGPEVCAALRRLPRGERVALFIASAAGRADPSWQNAYVDLRIDAFLAKPFSLTDLGAKVRAAAQARGASTSKPPTAAALPRTNTGSQPFPRTNSGSQSLPRTNTGSQPFPRTNTGSQSFPRTSTGSQSIPRTSTGSHAAPPPPAAIVTPPTIAMPRRPVVPTTTADGSTPATPRPVAAAALGADSIASRLRAFTSGGMQGVGAASKPPSPATPVRVVEAQLPHTLRLAADVPEHTPVATPVDVARVLLLASRARTDGVFDFVNGPRRLSFAFRRGVVVGSRSNVDDEQFGRWLERIGQIDTAQVDAMEKRMRERGERPAEALLAIGAVTPQTLLEMFEQQIRMRLRTALSWRGDVVRSGGRDAVSALTIGEVDTLEVVLGFAVHPMNQQAADAFVDARREAVLHRGADFEAGLTRFAGVRPQSRLPQLLLAGPLRVAEAAAASGATEVWALWLGELVRNDDDPAPDARPLAFASRTAGVSSLMDVAEARGLIEMLQQAQRASAYELVELPPSTSTSDMRRALSDLCDAIVKRMSSGAPLGPASASARELVTILESLIERFSSDDKRATHDAHHDVTRGSTARARDAEVMLEVEVEVEVDVDLDVDVPADAPAELDLELQRIDDDES